MDEFVLFVGSVIMLPNEIMALFCFNPYAAEPPTEEGEALFV
jgi:hypothetical protein